MLNGRKQIRSFIAGSGVAVSCLYVQVYGGSSTRPFLNLRNP